MDDNNLINLAWNLCLIPASINMKKIKIEDIVFWLLIIAVISIAIWKIFGSPTDTSSIIAIALFTVDSELIIWNNQEKIKWQK